MTVYRGANPFDQLTPVVRRLLVANVGVFFLQMVFPDQMLTQFGLLPADIVQNYKVWQVVTYAFLHGNGWHLFFNMFALWMFGPHIEGIWGSRRFTAYYFLCVVGAALAQFAIAPKMLVVGASGAIYGVLLAFGFLLPDAVIYLFFFFPVRAMQAVIFIAALTFVSALSSGGSRVAHFAHLGGMFTGFLYFKIPEWTERLRYRRLGQMFSKPKGRP
ncbi:MAG: rhomboid family intramembrane serine protease, partial [Elusimicrobia bacterium]|nr:rhomboid family intramembrane serine protease [Elusimicrobiota bacterium]